MADTNELRSFLTKREGPREEDRKGIARFLLPDFNMTSGRYQQRGRLDLFSRRRNSLKENC